MPEHPASEPPGSEPPAADISSDGPPDDVAALMARMASGDRAAPFELAARHGRRIEGAVRRHLRACGVHVLAPDDVDGLVLDVCLELWEIAGAWRPGGALPWWWASHRVRSIVVRWVGVHADRLEASGPGALEGPPPAPVDEPSVLDTLRRLVDEVPAVGLVAEACDLAAIGEAQLVCLLEYRIQQLAGDPSPSRTLAAVYGVTEDALRQRISRTRRRLGRVVADDARFEPLVGALA